MVSSESQSKRRPISLEVCVPFSLPPMMLAQCSNPPGPLEGFDLSPPCGGGTGHAARTKRQTTKTALQMALKITGAILVQRPRACNRRPRARALDVMSFDGPCAVLSSALPLKRSRVAGSTRKGIGGLALVGVAPAIANAVFNATGKRVRDLPITPEKLL